MLPVCTFHTPPISFRSDFSQTETVLIVFRTKNISFHFAFIALLKCAVVRIFYVRYFISENKKNKLNICWPGGRSTGTGVQEYNAHNWNIARNNEKIEVKTENYISSFASHHEDVVFIYSYDAFNALHYHIQSLFLGREQKEKNNFHKETD